MIIVIMVMIIIVFMFLLLYWCSYISASDPRRLYTTHDAWEALTRTEVCVCVCDGRVLPAAGPCGWMSAGRFSSYCLWSLVGLFKWATSLYVLTSRRRALLNFYYLSEISYSVWGKATSLYYLTVMCSAVVKSVILCVIMMFYFRVTQHSCRIAAGTRYSTLVFSFLPWKYHVSLSKYIVWLPYDTIAG